MRRRLLVVAVVVAMFTAAGAVVWAASAPDVGGCKEWAAPSNGGRVAMELPKFCKDKNCEILVSWSEGFMGAYSPGLAPTVEYLQFSGAGADKWVAGPSVSIGGLATGGIGYNGDGTYTDLFWGETANGSSVVIWDDSSLERSQHYLTLDVDIASPSNPDLEGVMVFICKR
jgi:hypothetical protein